MKKYFGEVAGDESVALRIRLFRLFCATTCVMCLAGFLPANLVQNLPAVVAMVVGLLGGCAGYFFRESLSGRHYFRAFFTVLLISINLVWFPNAGSNGSVVFCFFMAVIYPTVIFQGPARRVFAAVLVINLIGLLLLEHVFPAWKIPFQSEHDRLIDLIVGGGLICGGIIVLLRLMVAAYDREQQRLARYAERLGASERNYREIFNATSDALAIRDREGKLVDCNERMCTLYGYDRVTLLDRSIDELSLGEGPYSRAEMIGKFLRAATEGPQIFVWRARRSNGELFWSEVSLRVCEIGRAQRWIKSSRDISRRLQAEEILRTQAERLRLALAASNQGWFDLNLQSGEGRASAEYARIIGLEPVDFKVSAAEWLGAVHAEDRESVGEAFKECCASGESRTLEYRRKTRQGEWKWLRSIGKIVEWSPDGKPLRMMGTHSDITERKELESRLVHTKRLESVATLASGVAHDLNNILTPILMSVEIFGDKLSDPKDREMMAGLERGARRGARIVRQLLIFSRSVSPVRVLVDSAELMHDAAQAVRANFPANIQVIEYSFSGIWPVTADQGQLRQVLEYLCANSREAMPAGGTLTLSVENTKLTQRASTMNPWGKGGAFVVITVTDTGHGIAPEIMGRIFDPFFSTKEVGKGAGLGLSAVHGIVTGHGGNVTVESEPGQGATFRVFLPANLPKV